MRHVMPSDHLFFCPPCLSDTACVLFLFRFVFPPYQQMGGRGAPPDFPFFSSFFPLVQQTTSDISPRVKYFFELATNTLNARCGSTLICTRYLPTDLISSNYCTAFYLYYCCYKDCRFNSSLDVRKTSFLNGVFHKNEEVFAKQAPGFESTGQKGESLVMRNKKRVFTV